MEKIVGSDNMPNLRSTLAQLLELPEADFKFRTHENKKKEIVFGGGKAAIDSIVKSYDISAPQNTINVSEIMNFIFANAASNEGLAACANDPTCVVEVRKVIESALQRDGFTLEN